MNYSKDTSKKKTGSIHLQANLVLPNGRMISIPNGMLNTILMLMTSSKKWRSERDHIEVSYLTLPILYDKSPNIIKPLAAKQLFSTLPHGGILVSRASLPRKSKRVVMQSHSGGTQSDSARKTALRLSKSSSSRTALTKTTRSARSKRKYKDIYYSNPSL